jgi:hypothetical protein
MDRTYKGEYFHQTENDFCQICGGYDGCLKGCICPGCVNLTDDQGFNPINYYYETSQSNNG